jgi:hypothetical protein
MPPMKMILIGGWGIDDYPYRQRWLLREHAGETQSWLGPWLQRYVRYWSVMPPASMVPDLARFGSYTTGVTMHVYTDTPCLPGEQFGMVGMIPMPGQKVRTPGQTYAQVVSAGEEEPRVESTHCYTPFAPTQDFMGATLNPWSTSILRWFTCFKYPRGVSLKEGEDWYLNVHAREVMKQEGLIRYFSYRTLDWPGPAQWHRVTEQWYSDFASWHKAVIEKPPEYTKPSWAKYDQYPFLEPHKDFLGSFILERPTQDLMKDNLIYIIGP